MSNELDKINNNFQSILGKERGFFGCVYTWGQRPNKYEYIGYKLSADFLPTLQKMSDEQVKNFNRIVIYFEVHALASKEILLAAEKDNLRVYHEIAWSHFMTVIMFGMLEIAVKGGLGKGNLKDKGKKIRNFLDNNLDEKTKIEICSDYKVDDVYGYNNEINCFTDVIDHLWYCVRSGFIHDASMESRGLEWYNPEGMGTKEDPIIFKKDVPVQELLKMTWQAIVNNFGYRGQLIE